MPGNFYIMSKTKKDNLARYEILYIVSNEFSEDEVNGIDAKVQKIIEDNKAKVTKKTSLGKRQLAYKIQKFDYGYYNLIIFETERENIANIDRLVRQMREILRYCIVINESDDVESLKSKEQSPKIKEKKVITKTNKKDSPKPAAPKPSSIKKTKDEEEKSGLDKKLDDILEAKNLF